MTQNNNYRLVKHRIPDSDISFVGIRWVDVLEDGSLDISPIDEIMAARSVEEMQEALNSMNIAMTLPVIDEDTGLEI